MLIQWKNNKKGVLIIEILIVIAIIVIALTALLGVATFSLGVSSSIKKIAIANAMSRETVEVVRNFRDGTTWDTDGLGTLISGVAYYPQKTAALPPAWILTQGTETINGFTRKVVFENALRDANDNIVESGGTNDPDTRKTTVTVSWDDKEVEIVTYFTNWQ